MNLKFLLIPLLLMSYTPSTHAERLDISYKVPFVPLEIIFNSDGISFRRTKTIVTPIGSFSLGYSKYAAKFDEDYTYVIIEDMNQKKEHIYKIKDKKKLKLLSEGRTEITITKNRVHIIVEKGSRFTVKFSVDGEDELSERSAENTEARINLLQYYELLNNKDINKAWNFLSKKIQKKLFKSTALYPVKNYKVWWQEQVDSIEVVSLKYLEGYPTNTDAKIDARLIYVLRGGVDCLYDHSIIHLKYINSSWVMYYKIKVTRHKRRKCL
jgi:hypothetical protein